MTKRHGIALAALAGVVMLSSCARKEGSEPPKPKSETAAAMQPAQHALVHLKDGSKVPGTILASSLTDMIVAGDDGAERKIPLAQIRSVEYGETQVVPPARPASRRPAPMPSAQAPAPPPIQQPPPRQTAQQTLERPARLSAEQSAISAASYELPAGTEISVRTNEPIDSGTAAEGQTFDAQVTRDARNTGGDVVVPRGSSARIVIRSASKGGRFRGASDLALSLQSLTIAGRQYALDTADITQKGRAGIGANTRTAEYTGGGAALGAIIGALAGGGKGAAIGAGAGAGAGALTQVLTKGGAVKVPAESVLTFNLQQPLRVTAAE